MEIPTIKATSILSWLLHKSKTINLLYGSAGSGKTYQTAIYLINKFFTEKDITILVLRRFTPSLKLTCYSLILELIDKYYFPDIIEHNKTDMILRYKDKNNEMIFKGLDEESRIRSMNINYAWIEECSELTAQQYSQVLLRMRKPNINDKNKIILSTNPISVFSWVYTDIYSNPDPNIAHLKTTWRQNPFLPKDYIEQLSKLTGNYKTVYYDGDWGLVEGLIIPNFEIVDVIFDTIKDYVYAADFGYTNPSALVKVSFREDGKFFSEELIYSTGLTNTEFINQAKKVIPEYDIKNRVPIFQDSAMLYLQKKM